jgi:hypothetical protein
MSLNRRAFGLLGLASLSACAPVIEGAGLAPPGFSGPRLDPDALIAADGARLPMSVWPAVDACGRAALPSAVILALHGMDDYAGANVIAGPYWAARGVTTYAYDQRGFGRGAHRGLWPGQAALDWRRSGRR